jgi:hypothetical protein
VYVTSHKSTAETARLIFSGSGIGQGWQWPTSGRSFVGLFA